METEGINSAVVAPKYPLDAPGHGTLNTHSDRFHLADNLCRVTLEPGQRKRMERCAVSQQVMG